MIHKKKNDIHNEDQNNIKKDDEFIAKNFKEISQMKEDTEIKEGEPKKNTE